MIFAAIGDIHGNLPALEAVLRAVDGEGIQTIVNTGDCVVGHPWHNEVVSVLQARNIPSVQGIADRCVARFLRVEERLEATWPEAEFAALKETYQGCHGGTVEYLLGLPRKWALTIDGVEFWVCHGSLASQTRPLHEDSPLDHFRRNRELAAGARLIVSGGTHRAYTRTLDGTVFVDPGSVGMPAEGRDAPGKAAFTIVSTEDEPISTEVVYVEY